MKKLLVGLVIGVVCVVGCKSEEKLIRELKDKNEEVRSNAAFALGRRGDKRAVKPLIEALKDENERVRSSAARALGQIGDAKAAGPLIETMKDKDVRGNAVWALGEIGDKRAIRPLIKALRDKDWHVRWYAALALKKITGEDFGEDYNKWKEWYKKQTTQNVCP